jgi:predicted MFS family arabinose efflux permease
MGRQGRHRAAVVSPFAVGEFRALWLAYAQSIIGDQFARVALSIIVFTRTRSAGWTAATYALTYLPALVSGILLSGLADRFPRRSVMVVADLFRAPLVAVMALPRIPLPVLATLLVLVELAEAPFGAAQGASLPSILGEQKYEHGQRIMLMTFQAGQVAGFAAGGGAVAWLGPHVSLAVNAATFLGSAALVRTGVRARAAAAQLVAPDIKVRTSAQILSAFQLIWADRRLRALVGMAWLAGFTIVPEGLAAPFAAQISAGVGSIGLLLAAKPAGTVTGAYLLGRSWVGQPRRLHWLGPLAVGTSLPLILFLTTPALSAALALLAISGLCAAYQITAGATFVQLCPDHQRGQAFGLARSGLTAVQGLGIVVGGLVAQWSGTAATTIGIAGLGGSICALAAAGAWSRADPRGVATALTAHN